MCAGFKVKGYEVRKLVAGTRNGCALMYDALHEWLQIAPKQCNARPMYFDPWEQLKSDGSESDRAGIDKRVATLERWKTVREKTGVERECSIVGQDQQKTPQSLHRAPIGMHFLSRRELFFHHNESGILLFRF